MQIVNDELKEQEAEALAACYRLLLKKAGERRARLAAENKNNDGMETAVSMTEATTG